MKWTKEDIYGIIAYTKALTPLKRIFSCIKADFPFQFYSSSQCRVAAFTSRPSENSLMAYGKYIINAAGCVECHSKKRKGEIVPGTGIRRNGNFNISRNYPFCKYYDG